MKLSTLKKEDLKEAISYTCHKDSEGPASSSCSNSGNGCTGSCNHCSG